MNETVEGPTLWNVTTMNRERKVKGSRGKVVVNGDKDGASSLRINMTEVNSTFNYTTTQEVRTFYSKVCRLSVISTNGWKPSFEKCNYVLVIGKQYKCTRVCQTVSGLPETVVETIVLTQEDSLKKNSGQKKKNKERGKVKLPWTS